MIKLIKFWDGIKHLIKTINDEAGAYEKDYTKVKSESNDNLSLGRILKLSILTVVVRSVFKKDGKYYPQVFLDECLYELWKCNTT